MSTGTRIRGRSECLALHPFAGRKNPKAPECIRSSGSCFPPSASRLAPCVAGSAAGFTLLELVLATLISSLVIGILSIALSFSLRIWERQQNQKPNYAPAVMELLKWQLANFDPVFINSENGARPMFIGDQHSLTFATDHSVKALSKGVPVIVRYVYIPGEKTLYYAEIPLDPYHPEPIQEFLQKKPEDEKSWPRFYPTEMASFSIGYSGKEKDAFVNSWDSTEETPQAVLLKWTLAEDSPPVSYLVEPNFFLGKTRQTAQQENAMRGAGKAKGPGSASVK